MPSDLVAPHWPVSQTRHSWGRRQDTALGRTWTLKKTLWAHPWARIYDIYLRIGITFLIMMQGVAVKHHASILWYVHSLVSEVLSCIMGRNHPEWRMNALNLLICRVCQTRSLVTRIGYIQGEKYLFYNCSNIGTIALILCVGVPFMSNNSIQFFISLRRDMWMRGNQSKKP